MRCALTAACCGFLASLEERVLLLVGLRYTRRRYLAAASCHAGCVKEFVQAYRQVTWLAEVSGHTQRTPAGYLSCEQSSILSAQLLS